MKQTVKNKKRHTVAVLCLVFCTIASKVNAQEWFPVGAKWTYSAFYPCAGSPLEAFGIDFMECTKDTVIEGITAKVLKGSSKCAMSYGENIFYYNDTADIMYYYVDGAFRTYFDFSKKEGESYYMYFPKHPSYDSLLIEVDSVIIKPFAGINVRYQYISGKGVDYWYSFSSHIIEYVGILGSLYPIDGDCDLGHFTELRCHHDNTFSYYAKPIYEEQGCDIKLSVSDSYQNHDIKIYPNPTTGQLTIDNGELIIENVEIYNVMGQLLQSKIVNLQSKIEIDISHLAKGMYFLKVGNKVVRFVKN